MKRLLKHIVLTFLIPALLLGVVAACSSSECLDNKNSLPLAGFYSSSLTPQAISIDSISVAGIDVPGDSVLHDSVRSLSQAYLPFRIDQPETSYRISYLSGLAGKLRITDVITFKYEIQPWFVSSACGTIYKYRIQDISWTQNFIDSVTCPEGEITNAPGENLRIYFRVNIQEEGGEQ
ncbi:MAG: hypothetical protein K2J82_01005 [Muribaculaceae bacterium]|nr:hypothetical protein [Muribaculaceae bacterium]